MRARSLGGTTMPLDPFVTVMLERTRGLPAISDGSPDDARALIAAGREGIGTGPEMAETRDFALPTRSGSIPARLHVPEGEVKGLLVYLHGGGWVIGNIDDFDTLGRALAARSSCAVLLPDYRLAPESPFPGPVEDCEDAVLWALEAAGEEFGGAPVAVAGDSAGGNLATVVARRLLGQGPIVFQGLVYPVTDHDFSRPSYAAHAEGFPLLGRDMPWFFDHYLQGADPKQPDVSPLHADLTGLPPALVITAGYDVLLDEGLAYADALEAAGVPVTRRHAPGMIHGFIRIHNLCEAARLEVEALADATREACEAARAPA